MPSILDLPEPQKSDALRREGMTEEQFRLYMEGWKASIAAEDEATELHYGDDEAPAFEVKDPAD